MDDGRGTVDCEQRVDGEEGAFQAGRGGKRQRMEGQKYLPLFHVIASRFLAKQSPIYQARLTARGLLRRKERSSQ